MIAEAPPEKGKGLISYADKALISRHRQPHRQAKLTTEEVSAGANPVKGFGSVGDENLPRSVRRHLPARLKAAIAAERSTPKMHWR